MTSIPPPTPIPMFSIVACTSSNNNNNNNIDWNESINSIINQTYDKWELIIVFYNTEINHHITDLIKKYNTLDETTETNTNKKIRVLYYSDKLTYSETLLRVAKHESLYEYIAIMELGDTWAPIKLEKQAKTLIDYTKIDVLGTKSVYTEVVNNNTRKVISNNPTEELYKVNIFKTNPFINSTVVLKKSILEYLKSSQSKYDLNIFWVQLAVEQYNLYNLNDVMVKNHSLSTITEYNQCYSSQEMIETINNVKSKYIRIKFFSDFCDSYNCKSQYERMCMVDNINYYGKMKKMYITCTETYTHAIFLNCPTPSNLQVDKKYVIGFAQEPPNTPHLKLTQNNFIEYAIKNIGKYVGVINNIIFDIILYGV